MYNISIVCHIKCHTGHTLTYSHPVVLPISLSPPTLPLSKAGDASGIFPHWVHGTALLVPSVRGVLIQKWQASGRETVMELLFTCGVFLTLRGFEGLYQKVQISSDMPGHFISQTTSCLHPIMRRVSTGSWQNITNTPQENRKDRSEKGPLNAQRCYIMLQSNNPMPSDFHKGPQREYIQDLKSDIQHIQMYPHNISTCAFIFFPTPCNQTWFVGEIP